MRTTLPLALALLLVPACAQAPTPGGSPSSAAPAAGTTVANAASPSTVDPAIAVPSEPFSDAAKNFDSARKTLLAGYYRDAFTEDDLYRAALAGMLERADPTMRKWNKLLSPSELAALHSDLHGELVGVGVSIDLDPVTGYIDVKGTLPGTPADRAGIAPPDKIVTVDGKLYRGLTLRDVMNDIRGKAGDTVTLTILRGAQLVNVPLVREKFAYDGVTHTMLPGDVGYVRIPAFNERTPPMLKDALTDLVGHHARSAVLDLRDNQGGGFDASIAAAGEMVPAGSIISTLDKRGKIEPTAPSAAQVLPDMPMAVLVDHETASSAELVAAAMRDLRHASLVGATTTGKWTVQTIEDLPNGYAMKYTLAVFRAPSGKSYDGTGLTPDVEVDMPDDAIAKARLLTDTTQRVAQDTQLRTAVALLTRPR